MDAKISKGNSKLGTISNVSLPPITTCMLLVLLAGKLKRIKPPCWDKCYAMKSQRQYPETRSARAHNLRAYRTTPREFFSSIVAALNGNKRRAPLDLFRWQVAGDSPDDAYFAGVVDTAEKTPHTRHLMFTKRYAQVNAYLDSGKTLPSNLSVVFSAWPDHPMHNPHGLPVAFMVPKVGTEERLDGTEIACTGNCETCGMCWSLRELKRNVAFHQH